MERRSPVLTLTSSVGAVKTRFFIRGSQTEIHENRQ
jgi:hypothetical protein